MNQYNMGYHLKEGFHSIFTHGLMSFAAVCMIVACLIIMGSFSLVAINIDNTLGRYEAENEFIAYIDETLAEDEARALQSKLEAIPNVSSVTFMTAGEALERYTERVTSRRPDKGVCLRVGFVGGDVRRERRRKGKEA